MTENESEEGKERQYYDNASVRGMLDYLEVDGDLRRVRRLGKRKTDPKDARPRPILVEFSTIESSAETKRKASRLRFGSSEFKEIYIQADLTKKEREARKELVKELKKRHSEGDKNWVIRGDKLVKRKDPSMQSNKESKHTDKEPFRSA